MNYKTPGLSIFPRYLTYIFICEAKSYIINGLFPLTSVISFDNLISQPLKKAV